MKPAGDGTEGLAKTGAQAGKLEDPHAEMGERNLKHGKETADLYSGKLYQGGNVYPGLGRGEK